MYIHALDLAAGWSKISYVFMYVLMNFFFCWNVFAVSIIGLIIINSGLDIINDGQ